jgi:glycosyltransferase involved in cell wall biosynthesis
VTSTNGSDADRRVGVFREYYLPRSETFVRDHLLHLESWKPLPITTNRLPDSLAVPGLDVIDGSQPQSLPLRIRRGLTRRLGGDTSRLGDAVLADVLRRSEISVVHAHFGTDAAVALPAARAARLPLVATFWGYDATVYPEILQETPSGALLLERWDELFEYSTVIAVSTFLRDELVRRGAPEGEIHVIPSGVPTDKLPWSEPPRDGGILFVGRLVGKKGCADLLRAVSALQHAPTVRIIGDGPLRADLEALAAQLGVDVEFLGVRDSRYVKEAMRAASIVAMPSQRAPDGDCEGMPLVSLEASAMGRPVVGYSHSGMVDSIVSGETGLLAPEGDVDQLAANLDAVLGDPDELLRMARNARAHVESHFELRDCLRRIEGLYDAAAGRST